LGSAAAYGTTKEKRKTPRLTPKEKKIPYNTHSSLLTDFYQFLLMDANENNLTFFSSSPSLVTLTAHIEQLREIITHTQLLKIKQLTVGYEQLLPPSFLSNAHDILIL